MPKLELLKDAYAIIGGIPAENIRLKTWRRQDNGPSCGTIACAAGWLTLHPQFQALGLTTSGVSSTWHPHCPVFEGRTHTDAMGELFEIPDRDAEWLFSERGHFRDRHIKGGKSDKNLFLARVRAFLQEHGQLKEQLEGAAHV